MIRTTWTATLILATMLASAAFGPSPVQIRFSHWVPTQHPMHVAAVAWAESIEKASNGSIKIANFPAQQLGKAFDHYNMARDGIVEFAYVNPGYEPGRFPIIAAGEIPFLVGDVHGGIRRCCRIARLLVGRGVSAGAGGEEGEKRDRWQESRGFHL